MEAEDIGGRGDLKWEGHTRGQERDVAPSLEKTQRVFHLIMLALGYNYELSGGRPQILCSNTLSEILSSCFLGVPGGKIFLPKLSMLSLIHLFTL